MYDNSKTKGNRAELNVLYRFSEAGFSVSIPFGDNAPYDLIVESPSKKLYRIQTRWCSWKGEVLSVSLQRSSQGVSFPLDLTRIDAMVAFDGKDLYLIPVTGLTVATAIQLRRSPAKNGQTKGVRLSSDFKDRFDLLP